MIIICLLALPVLHAQEQPSPDPKTTETDGLSIVVTSLDITDNALKVQYEIRNDSEQDIWIYFGEYVYDELDNPGIETYIAEDGQTLTLRSSLEPRIEIENNFFGPPVQYYGNYVRLRPGEHQSESIVHSIPFYANSLTKQIQQKEQELKYATRLAIELAYYPGNIIENINRAYKSFHIGLVYRNETTFSRNEQILILQHGLAKIEDPILRTVVNNLSIPYRLGKHEGYKDLKIDPPDLSSCVKIEFEYKPSILEHLFPYPTQKNLLSLQEKEYLRTQKIAITDPNKIKIFTNDVSIRTKTCGVDCERIRSYIEVICHCVGKTPTSFTIYNGKTISIDGVHLGYYNLSSGKLVILPETFSCFKEIIPHIQEIDLRMKCAANMEDLWYRLCFHHGRLTKLKEGPKIRTLNPYPDSKTWCDSLHSFRIHLTCPSAGEGKCHYAMNPNCDPNSPDDMVLLFETRAGWNQHGGPELFTFDNHKPTRPAPDVLSHRDSGGGCVLLNDGTVKFIRTEEELHSLKWK